MKKLFKNQVGSCTLDPAFSLEAAAQINKCRISLCLHTAHIVLGMAGRCLSPSAVPKPWAAPQDLRQVSSCPASSRCFSQRMGFCTGHFSSPSLPHQTGPLAHPHQDSRQPQVSREDEPKSGARHWDWPKISNHLASGGRKNLLGPPACLPRGQHKETAPHECPALEQDTEWVQTYERIWKQGDSLLRVSRRCSCVNTGQCLLWKMPLLVKAPVKD